MKERNENFTKSFIFTVRTIARFGEFFWSARGIRTRKSFCRLAEEDWRTVLVVFLESYAFERQGRPPRYPEVAAKAVREYQSKFPECDFEQSIWDRFLQEISLQKANVLSNPMAVSFNEQKSITSFVAGLGQWDYNLIRWAETGLKCGKIKQVYDELRQVRGLGPKIVSLFLRDIVTAFEIDELALKPARYLQPIDRWTKRGAEVLSIQMEKPKPDTDLERGKIIVEASVMADECPSLVNAGLWIFGAWFAQKEVVFRDTLATPEKLTQFLKRVQSDYLSRAEFVSNVLYTIDNIKVDKQGVTVFE